MFKMEEREMSRRFLGKAAALLLMCLCSALLFAACGGSSSSSGSSTGSSAGATSGEEAETGGGGDTGAAAATVKPFIGQPSAFPVTEKLKEVPKGATVAYVDCGTPYCALFWQLLSPAAKTMGVHLERVKAGSAANTVSAAFDSVLAKKPDAVIVTAISIELWKNQLKELQEAEIPVVTTGVTGTEAYGIEGPQAAEALSELAGKLMANYVVAEMDPEADAVVYEVPELPYTKIIDEVFTEELERVCSACSVRTATISASELGSTAPTTVVSDLQANPDTSVAVFTSPETVLGLPAALQAAGIDVETLTYAATPQNLEYIKEGKQTASLEVDLPVLSWTLLDEAARGIVGQKLTGPESEGITDVQFLTQKDIAFDPSKGWTGYPNFAEMFAELWGVKG
jgi:ribose transport system substrate-binding protein